MNNSLTMDHPWVLSFSDQQAAKPDTALALVGGKGANLARMVQVGLPVPEGFLISTRAYEDFVRVNDLEARIQQALPGISQPSAQALETASDQIRELFLEGSMPPDLEQRLRRAYRDMCASTAMGTGMAVPVAVRSSATAEDLPEMSFAGQQDTYLNVQGEEELLQAVVRCWSSLWTARAIGYRSRNQVSQQGAALAVVVQRMVESQVSGVMFTANPVRGMRSETVIDATFGLGEALVSGRVEPDHYVVDTATGLVRSKTVGAKILSIHGRPGGGTVEVEEVRKNRQALTESQIIALAQLGQRVADYYGSPQDIEWAWADDRFYLLQSRAVTSLFPLPKGMPPEPLKVMFSFAAVQGMLDPMTPLGRYAIRMIFAVGSRLYHIHVNADTQTVLFEAGERLWVNMTTMVQNTVGRKAAQGALSMVEPTVQQALIEIWEDPRLQPQRKGIRPHAMVQILGVLIPGAWNVLLNLASPVRRREKIVGEGEYVLKVARARLAEIDAATQDMYSRLARQARLLQELMDSNLPNVLLHFVSAVASGMASFHLLRVLANQLPEQVVGPTYDGWPQIVLEVTRGLPNNPTTEMDLALWAIAKTIKSKPELRKAFLNQPVNNLEQQYRSGTLPQEAQALIDRFLERYGGRGLAEIDLGRERWFEEPLHIFEVLSGYLQIEQKEQAPDAVFTRGAEAAEAAVDRLAGSLRRTRRGWLKTRLARFAASRVRVLLGARESPKFFAVRLMGLVRHALLESGSALVTNGDLQRADDLFFLTFPEIEAFAFHEDRDWKGIIARRRAAYEREMLRRQVPRLLLSDGRAFYEGMRPAPQNGSGLTGSPVSPGSVEGRVRVVFDPRQANLQPGEILVCPGTDPSWTPLFLTASGLIMEVGGMMTHGAVVAREYGIPAVVGVDQATKRLVTGQRIRLDGASGLVEILDGKVQAE